jgi:ribose-phosphate pyrophosphokinase
MNYGKLKIFAGSSHPAFAQAVADGVGVPLGKVECLRFSNENIMVRILESVRGADVFVIQTMAPPVSDNILESLIMIDALASSSAARITAVLPYFPYSRSDKKDQPRVSITARLMADLYEQAGAHRFLTTDLHAPQITGFFHKPVDQLIAAPVICDYYRKRDLANHVLVAGDAGEAKELARYAARLDLPMAIVDKRRYGNDDKAKATNLIGDVRDKHCLIIDDEIATGGTLMEAMTFLKRNGALSVSAAAVHGVLSSNAHIKLTNSEFDEIVVCDTVPVAHKKTDKLHILSVADQFADAIKRIHTDQSCSDLFR